MRSVKADRPSTDNTRRRLRAPGRRRFPAAAALVLLGVLFSSCSHQRAVSPGPYNISTTSTVVTTTIPPTAPTTPQTNWMRVVFHQVKVRIPPSWLVVRSGRRPCRSVREPGTLWVGKPHKSCQLWVKDPGESANMVIFGGRSVLPHGAVLGHERVNGYPADIYSFGPADLYGQHWLRGTAEYWFPTLGVTVAFSGPLGIEVVKTVHALLGAGKQAPS
jgi:hypothetical protein